VLHDSVLFNEPLGAELEIQAMGRQRILEAHLLILCFARLSTAASTFSRLDL
jgi:hypothetical protein